MAKSFLNSAEIKMMAVAVAEELHRLNDEILTAEDVMALLHKPSKGAVIAMCKKKLLPFRKYHGQYIFSRHEITAFLLSLEKDSDNNPSPRQTD